MNCRERSVETILNLINCYSTRTTPTSQPLPHAHCSPTQHTYRYIRHYTDRHTDNPVLQAYMRLHCLSTTLDMCDNSNKPGPILITFIYVQLLQHSMGRIIKSLASACLSVCLSPHLSYDRNSYSILMKLCICITPTHSPPLPLGVSVLRPPQHKILATPVLIKALLSVCPLFILAVHTLSTISVNTGKRAQRELCYVAAKATFVCFMAKSAFWVFFGPSSVKMGQTHIVLGRNMQCASTSTYPENLGSGGLLPAELRGRVCLFVCFLFVRHATMLGTESLDGAYTH